MLSLQTANADIPAHYPEENAQLVDTFCHLMGAMEKQGDCPADQTPGLTTPARLGTTVWPDAGGQ